jgi:hypothetical protein
MPADLGRGVVHLASAFRLPAEFKHPGFSLPPETGTSHYTRENYAVTWAKTNLPSLVKTIDGTVITPLQDLSVDGATRNPPGHLPDTLLHLKEDLSRLTYLQVNFPDAQPSPPASEAYSYVEKLAPVQTLVGWSSNPQAPTVRHGIQAESRILARKSKKGVLLANEYLVEPPGRETEAARPLSHLFLELLAQRRSLLFAPALAERIYNVMFPLGILTDSRGVGFALIPWITLIRGSFTSRVRHTIEFGMFVLPITDHRPEEQELSSVAELEERNLDIGEVVRIAARGDGSGPTFSWERNPHEYKLSGPLRRYLVDLRHHLQDCLSLETKVAGEVVRSDSSVVAVLDSILEGLTAPTVTMRKATEGLNACLVGQLFSEHSHIKRKESRIRVEQFGDEIAQSIAMNLVISVLSCAPENIAGDRDDGAKGVAKVLDQWVGYQGTSSAKIYEEPSWALFHLEPHRCFLILYDSTRREFPTVTPLQPIGWLAYIMGSLAALTEMLTSFYHEIEEPEDIGQLLGVTSDIVLNFDEIYDLDILWHAYRRVYDRCVKALKIDHDYDQLMRKVGGIRAEVETTSRIRTENSVQAIGLLGAVVAIFVVLIEASQLHAIDNFLWHRPIGLAIASLFLLLTVIMVLYLGWHFTERWRYRRRARRYIAWDKRKWLGHARLDGSR